MSALDAQKRAGTDASDSLSLGTGRPLTLRDDESVRHARLILAHPMASETDVRLVACVELLSYKSEPHAKTSEAAIDVSGSSRL